MPDLAVGKLAVQLRSEPQLVDAQVRRALTVVWSFR